MIFTEKKITLKDGKAAILRSPHIEDAKQLISHLIMTCGESDFLTKYPEENARMTIEQEEEWIRSHLASPYALVICCEIDGKIAASCDLRFNSSIKLAHRVCLGITVQKQYWNIGIGSALFKEMIEASRSYGVSIMELEFTEGNERAKHLYEKFGFRVVSEKPNAFRLKDGRMLSEFYMQKYL